MLWLERLTKQLAVLSVSSRTVVVLIDRIVLSVLMVRKVGLVCSAQGRMVRFVVWVLVTSCAGGLLR